MPLFTIIPILLILFDRTRSETWNYADLGPDVWSDVYPLCSGRSQSPINIQTACTTYRSWTPFQFSSIYNTNLNYTLTNNGHTIVANYPVNGSSPFVLNGGGLGSGYQFVNFHLHWGQNYRSGSEHQVNGVKYAGELHVVHMQPQTNQVAVLGFLIQSRASGNTTTLTSSATIAEWAKYFNGAKNLAALDNTMVLSLNLGLLMGNNLNDFWRYNGSLTTPPCSEGVIWTVFKTPITFTDDELNSFRTNLFPEDYRHTQPLNGRRIYRNFPDEITSSISDYNYCSQRLAYSSANRLLREHSFLFILFINYRFFLH